MAFRSILKEIAFLEDAISKHRTEGQEERKREYALVEETYRQSVASMEAQIEQSSVYLTDLENRKDNTVKMQLQHDLWLDQKIREKDEAINQQNQDTKKQHSRINWLQRAARCVQDKFKALCVKQNKEKNKINNKIIEGESKVKLMNEEMLHIENENKNILEDISILQEDIKRMTEEKEEIQKEIMELENSLAQEKQELNGKEQNILKNKEDIALVACEIWCKNAELMKESQKKEIIQTEIQKSILYAHLDEAKTDLSNNIKSLFQNTFKLIN